MSLIKQTRCLVHTFSNRHVCSMRHFLGYLYSLFSHFKITNFFLTSLHIISFCAIILQVEFAGVLRSVPLRRNEIRSILLRGQIRLKDTTLSLGSDLLLNNLFALQVCFLYVFSFWSFKRTRELHSLPLKWAKIYII